MSICVFVCVVSSVPQMIIKTLFTITVKPKCLISLFDNEPMDFRFSYNNTKRTFTSYSLFHHFYVHNLDRQKYRQSRKEKKKICDSVDILKYKMNIMQAGEIVK